jgi:ABC-type nitrate/sulfonate/bicarbonate transport system permease component
LSHRRLLPGITALVLLGVLEALAQSRVLPPEVSAPSRVAIWLWANSSDAYLWASVGATMTHWALGLFVGALLGCTLGWLMATFQPINQLLLGIVEFLRPIPGIVYLPVLLLLMGASSQVAVYLAGVGALWPVLFQTFYGVKDVDPVMEETARVFGLSRLQRLRWVTFPTVLPYLSTGLRVASSIALLAALAIELVGGIPGLGNTLGTYSTNGQYDASYSVIVIGGVIGAALNALFELADRKLLNWHSAYRPSAS